MPVVVPSRRPAFEPIGRLRTSPLSGGKKGGMLNLNLTPMVDMFTVIVIFLLQTFQASGEIMFAQKDVKLPEAQQSEFLEERGPVVTLYKNRAEEKTDVIVDGNFITSDKDLDEAESGIPAVTERLVAEREKMEKMNERLGKVKDPSLPFEGHIIMQADQEVDFMLVRKCIFSLNEAGWTHINFVALGVGKAPAEGEGEGEGKVE